jgi:hypothetical protein
MSAPFTCQPEGSAAMQGSRAAGRDGLSAEDHRVASAAVGSGCADVVGREEGRHARHGGDGDDEEHSHGQAQALDAPALQHDRWPSGCEGAELAQQVAGIPFHERAQLGRAGYAAGGGEGFGQLGRGEITHGAPVDALRVGAHRQHEHHVAEINRLPPGRWAHLGEGDVDQHQISVVHHEVAGLDVTMGDSRVP